MADEKRPTSIGIHNTGKDNTFVDISTEGFDVGIRDDGTGSRYHRVRNIFRGADGKMPWFQRPLGIVVLAVIAGLIIAVAIYWLGLSH